MPTPKVSVIIPTYNAELFVAEAIASVADQNYDNLEIVVCDDCSKDRTADIVRELAERYPGKIKFLANEINLGVTKNCNLALSLCTGDYIAFHAGDDVMLPGKIQAQVDYMEGDRSCSICYHNVEVFLSSTNETLYFYNSWKNPPRSGGASIAIKYGCFNSGCATMVRRSHLPEGGYDEKFPVASDWHLWIRVLLNGGEIRYIDRVLSRYRRHDSNITSSNSFLSKQAVLDSLNVTNWVLVNHPEYISEAMSAFAISIRALRRFQNGANYKRALWCSWKTRPNLLAAAGLFLNLISFGRIKV